MDVVICLCQAVFVHDIFSYNFIVNAFGVVWPGSGDSGVRL